MNGVIEKVGKMLGCFAKAKEMGDRGKENFRELFTAKRTGDGFMKMYRTDGQ